MANNYIVTSASNPQQIDGFINLKWEDLYAASFAFNTPFHLTLSDHQLFLAERVVRVIPKRRMVVFGTWQGRRVAAKLFFAPKYAKKQMEKDIAGINLLKKNKIPTPELYYQGNTPDKKVYVLIFERIVDAKNLEEIWRNKKSIDEVLPVLQSVVIEVATQHVLGLMQQDLHMRNFLLNDSTIYTLDGAQIEQAPELLSKKISMNNLALFLSQLGVDSDGYQEKLYKHYAEARGWTVKQEDVTELFMLIKKWNDVRWKKYAKKVFRESSEYVHLHHWQALSVYHRRYEGPEFIQFLSHPDSAFRHPTSKLLKRGRSATVVKVTLDSREYVVKRYNMKNMWHRLRRCLRATRAVKSWRLAQKLSLFDIPTAKPVAFIEYRVLGLRGKSYYVTEYVRGDHAGDYFDHHRHHDEKIASMVKRISTLLKNVAKLEITHGDLKITNILIDEHEQPVLIDLDGAAEHLTLSGLRKAWRKEINRFLDNFHYQRPIRDKFEAELGR